MMEFLIVSVGDIKEQYNISFINDYLKRISKYAKVKEIVLKDYMIDDAKVALRKEGEKLLDIIENNYYNILLDIKGKSIDSIAFADLLSEIATYKSSKICFVIGGSHGVSDAVKSKCDFLLSFSKMTFPHQLMKGILAEQIYRACKIINNERYHK